MTRDVLSTGRHDLSGLGSHQFTQTMPVGHFRSFLTVVAALTLASACGGSEGNTDSSTTAVAAVQTEMDTSVGSNSAESADVTDDLESFSTVTPRDRQRLTIGSIELLLTSYCGEQIGNGVEILATGLEPLEMLEFTVNNQSTFVQGIQGQVGVQYRSSTRDRYVVEVPVGSGSETVELDGCE